MVTLSCVICGRADENPHPLKRAREAVVQGIDPEGRAEFAHPVPE
jgi:hypothetical protein